MQFLKFVSVGAIGTAFHYATLIGLTTGFDIDPGIGAMSGASVGAIFNYGMNHRFTFQSDRSHTQALPRFILVAGLGVFLNGLIVKLLTTAGLHYLLSQVAATLIILFLNYIVSKTWIFRNSR